MLIDLIFKVSLLTAADFWRTKSIPEKGIPAIKTSDGPNGARGGIFVGGTKVGIELKHPFKAAPSTDTHKRLPSSRAVYPWRQHGTRTSSTRLVRA